MMPSSAHFGRPILPASSHEIFRPINSEIGPLEVRADHKSETHYLTLSGREIARHANGFSCHVLGKRIASGDMAYAKRQANGIIACGGSADLSIY